VLEAEPADSRRADAPAASRSAEDSAAAERVDSEIAERAHCAAVADDSPPDEAAADSVRRDSARHDSARDERSVAPSTDAHCAPVVLDDSCPDGCRVPVDSVQDDSAGLRAPDHCALAARTHDCCPAGYLGPVGSAEGDWPDWAQAGLAVVDWAVAGWAVACCCSAHLNRADCLAAQAPDDPSALVAQTDGSHQVADDCPVGSVVDDCRVGSVADDCRVDSAADDCRADSAADDCRADWVADDYSSADFPAEADSPDCSCPGVRSLRADSPEPRGDCSADSPGEPPPPGAELLSLAAQ